MSWLIAGAGCAYAQAGAMPAMGRGVGKKDGPILARRNVRFFVKRLRSASLQPPATRIAKSAKHDV